AASVQPLSPPARFAVPAFHVGEECALLAQSPPTANQPAVQLQCRSFCSPRPAQCYAKRQCRWPSPSHPLADSAPAPASPPVSSTRDNASQTAYASPSRHADTQPSPTP